MKIYGGLILLLVFLNSCKNGANQSVDTDTTTNSGAGIDEKKQDSFFPVTSFIKGQIITLDSLPVTPLQITSSKGKADSAWITKEQLKPLLTPFLEPVINETNYRDIFKETRFNDQTLNAVTFTYDPVSTVPDSVQLRHWDVYINPENGNVKKVYIVKQIKENGKVYIQQLTWQSNKQAKVVTILVKPDGTMDLQKEVVYVWSFTTGFLARHATFKLSFVFGYPLLCYIWMPCICGN